MVVDKFNVLRMAVDPRKTNAPLIVHPNTVLSRAIPAESLQSVARRKAEIVQSHRRVDVAQLPQHHAAKIRRVTPDRLPLPQAPGVTIGEAPDHSQ